MKQKKDLNEKLDIDNFDELNELNDDIIDGFDEYRKVVINRTITIYRNNQDLATQAFIEARVQQHKHAGREQHERRACSNTCKECTYVVHASTHARNARRQ